MLLTHLCLFCDWSADDSDDDKEVSRKPRQVRQAASKAVSKQREILLGDGGSEDEEKDDEEQAFIDRKFKVLNFSFQFVRERCGVNSNWSDLLFSFRGWKNIEKNLLAL